MKWFLSFGCAGSSLLPVGLGATLLCMAQASHCGLVFEHGLWSVGPVVVVQGLSCSTARGIFPDQGSNLSTLRCGKSEVVSHRDFAFHPLMADGVKHLFMCLLSICVSSVQKRLCTFMPVFSLGSLFEL